MLKPPRSLCAGVLLLLWLLRASAGAQDLILGVGTHSAPDQGLALIGDAGVTSLRDDIHWQEVERAKGVLVMPERYERYVDEALRRGIEPVLILCYGNPFHDGGGYPVSDEATEAYARFAEFVVSHFRGRIHRYEIWNEWNIAISLPPGTPRGRPEPYVALLGKVYPRLKAIDPELTVIGGALSGNAVDKGWLEAACRAGLLDSLDAFSFHPYCYREAGQGRLPENGFLKQIRDSQAVTRRYQKREIPVYVTEVGWPTHDGPDGSTPADAARFLARTYLLARTLPFVRGLWWYDLRDDGPDPHEREHHFGLASRDFTPKPAYAALADVCRWFQGARFEGRLGTDPETYLLRFRRGSGAALFVWWSSGEAASEVRLETASAVGPPPATLHEPGGRETTRAWRQDGARWRLTVPVTGSPCFVECDASPIEATASRRPE